MRDNHDNHGNQVGALTNQLNECNTDLESAKTQVNNYKVTVSNAEAALTEEKGKTARALANPVCPRNDPDERECLHWIKPVE